jgi:hypothetical protein
VILKSVNMKNTVFKDVTPCSLAERYQRFGGTCLSNFKCFIGVSCTVKMEPIDSSEALVLYTRRHSVTPQKTVMLETQRVRE